MDGHFEREGRPGSDPIEDPRLPDLLGGWDLVDCELELEPPCRLWVPRAPDGLLDDEDVQERNRFNDSMPYWAWLWDSAPVMARIVAQMPWEPGTRVLELGAGLGLVGLAAALGSRGSIELTLSDRDPMSLSAMRASASLNDLPGVRVVDLDWRAPSPELRSGFDVILGCDVTYEGQSHGPLLDAIEHCMAADGRALLADPGRTRLTQFMRRATERGFAGGRLSDEAGAPAGPETGAFRLLELRRSR